MPVAGSPIGAATTGATLLSGGSWSLLGILAPQVFTLIVSVVAARNLGIERMGIQSLISFVEASLVVALATGIQWSLLRFVGDSLGRGSGQALTRILSWCWRVQLLAALAGGAVLALIGFFQPELQSAWLFSALSCSTLILLVVPFSLLKGLQRWREATIITLGCGVATVVATVVILSAGGGITEMFAVGAAASVVALLWTLSLYRRALHSLAQASDEPDRPFTPGLQREVKRHALASTGSAVLFLFVWQRSEFFFLARYSAPEEIAVYSIAFAVVAAVGQLPFGLSIVLTPAVAHLTGAGAADRIPAGLLRARRILVLPCLPLTAGVLVVAPRALTVVYGAEYARAGRVLSVLVLVLPLVALFHLSSSVLAALGRVRSILTANLVATALLVPANLLLVPRYGAVGAAIANAAAQTAACVVAVASTRRELPVLHWGAPGLVRAVLASFGVAGVAAVGVNLFSGMLGAVAGSLAGLVLFGLLARSLRLVPAVDASWLDERAGSSLGGIVHRLCKPFLPAGGHNQGSPDGSGSATTSKEDTPRSSSEH